MFKTLQKKRRLWWILPVLLALLVAGWQVVIPGLRAGAAGQVNNKGVSPDGQAGQANLDGVGYSYSASALSKAGIAFGQQLVFQGSTLSWLATDQTQSDNVQAAGQTIAIPASAPAGGLWLVGSSTHGPSQGKLTLTYTDGSTHSATLAFSDWTLNGGRSRIAFGNEIVAQMPYRNSSHNQSGRQMVTTYLFAALIPLQTQKTLKSLTLPQAANRGHLHLFALGITGGSTATVTTRSTPTAQPTSTPTAAPTSAPIQWSGPITITKGGTYSGNWQSTSSTVPAVSIRTSEPVVLENCRVRGSGHLITGRFSNQDNTSHMNIVVRNCSGTGVTPNEPGKAEGFFFLTVYPDRVRLENNTIEGTRGIEMIGQNQPGMQQEIAVLRNRAHNLDGRTRNGVTCSAQNDIPFTSNDGACGASFVQLSGIVHVPNIEIAWNEVINDPDQGHVDDNINIYNSSGTPTSPIQIHDNYIQGAYPTHPASDPYTGSGIDLADGDGNADVNHVTSYVTAFHNQVVSTANVGIFIASGHDNLFYENRVVSSGYLPDGRHIKNHFTGIYVWDCCYGQTKKSPPVMYNDVARDNLIGYAYINDQGQAIRSDTYLPDCAKNADGSSKCVNNQSIAGPITLAMERNEYQLWRQKVADAQITLGVA